MTGCSSHDCKSGTLSEEARATLGDTWSSRAVECSLAGYLVMGPASDPKGDLAVIRKDHAMIMITASNEIIVLSNSKVALTIQDRDGDGAFDFLSYRTAPGKGSAQAYVTDSDLDGQLDEILPGDGHLSVSIDGKWYPLDRREGRNGVITDGEWRPVAPQGGRWEF